MVAFPCYNSCDPPSNGMGWKEYNFVRNRFSGRFPVLSYRMAINISFDPFRNNLGYAYVWNQSKKGGTLLVDGPILHVRSHSGPGVSIYLN